jgi:AcrR family transcriptional regulator
MANSAAKVPPSARGRRTRAALIKAAREVFERDGFTDSRIVDITTLSANSVGTFYTYFEDKEEILNVVLAEALDEVLERALWAKDTRAADEPLTALSAALRSFLEHYRDHVKLMLLIEQAAGIDPEFRADKRRRERDLVRLNADIVRDWRERGLAQFDMDPVRATSALSGMMNRIAYNSFVFGESDSVEELVEFTTQLWSNALGIRDARE